MSLDSPQNPDALGLEWLDRARNGSATSLGEMLSLYREYLLAIAQREMPADLQAKAGASDLVQETFLEAHRDFPSFQGATEAELLVWLRRILLHNLEDFVRHYRNCAKRQISREANLNQGLDFVEAYRACSQEETPSRIVAEREQADWLLEAMGRLNEDYQRVLKLRYWEGRQFDEIGRLLGRSGEAARKLWFRAVQALQRELKSVEEASTC